MKNKTVCIVGLGYVGLPLAEAFSKHLSIIGYDIHGEKVKRLSESNNEDNLEFTSDPARIREADFVLICVPTPVTKSKEPDLRYVKLFCKQKPLLKKCLRYFFASQKPLLKNAYAISSGNCRAELEEGCNRSSGVHNLSWSY